MAVFLASDLAKGISGRLFTARGGYVGVHAAPSESLLAYRDEAEGPWPVASLAERVRAGLGFAPGAEADRQMEAEEQA